MSKSSFARYTSAFATLFAAAVFMGACAIEGESGETDEELDAELGQTDEGEEVGESADAIKFINPTTGTGTGDPTNGCGWFCPWWAKDLSDCIIRVCNDGGYAP